MPCFVVTYSAQIDNGTVAGRCFVTMDKIETERDIEKVDEAVLEHLKKIQPTAHRLFATWWKQLAE